MMGLMPAGVGGAPGCGTCRHFRNDPAEREAQTPGLSALSSAYGSVHGSNGLCSLHERHVSAGARCDRYGRQIR